MPVVSRSGLPAAVLGVLALLASLVLPLAGGLPAAAAQTVPDREHVLTHGHVDGFEVTFDAATGVPVLGVKDDTRIHDPGTVFRTPESTTFAYEDVRSVQTLPPASGAWAFLGAYGGTDAWVATQTGGDQGYAPWVGWSTERLTASLAGTDVAPAPGTPVSIQVAIDGPGDVFTFMSDSFGGPINRYLDTTTSAGGTIPVSANAHVHTNWVFTAEGDYTLVATPSLATADGRTLTGEPRTYHVRVGERAPEPVTTSVTVVVDAASYTEGDTATFTASQDPVTELSTYRWEVAAAGSDEFAAVEGVLGATYERTLVATDDAARVRAVLIDGERAAGTSEPVTLDVAPAPEPEPTPEPSPEPEPTPDPEPGPDPTPDPGPVPGASEPNRQHVLTHGHVDGFEVTYDAASGGLALSVKDDTRIYDAGPVHRSPSDVTIAYEDARAVQALPAAEGAWSFLGGYGGTDAWVGTQTGADQTYVPWVGWSTERLLSTLQGTGITPAAGSPVSLAVEVDGPGDVLTFQNDAFGNPVNRYVDTTASVGGTIPVTANAHVHTNWVFTAEGDYHLTVTPSLRTADGGTVAGASADYHVRVGAYAPPFEPLPEEELTDANRGDLTLDRSRYALADDAVASSSALTEARKVVAFVYSEPTSAGELTATDGAVSVTIPTAVGTGEHKLALYDSASGALLGWAPFEATDPAATPDDGTDDGTPGGTDGGDVTGTGGPGSGGGAGPGVAAPDQCLPTPVTTEARTPVVDGITDGHFDFGSVVEDGVLVAQVKDDRKQPPTWAAPESLTFRLGDAARREVPAGTEFSFLGETGSTIWSIGQVQEPNVPWVGWNTQHPSLVEAAAGPVTYTLDRVDGPGTLGVYATGNFGGVGTRYLGTMDGFPRSMTVPLNQHVHGNWAFSEQGVYQVTITQSVPLTSGGTVSDSATLTFSVGDSSGTATRTTYVGRTASGQDCELSADQKAALAATGADPASALALGALLLVTGATLYGVSRRRRTS